MLVVEGVVGPVNTVGMSAMQIDVLTHWGEDGYGVLDLWAEFTTARQERMRAAERLEIARRGDGARLRAPQAALRVAQRFEAALLAIVRAELGRYLHDGFWTRDDVARQLATADAAFREELIIAIGTHEIAGGVAQALSDCLSPMDGSDDSP